MPESRPSLLPPSTAALGTKVTLHLGVIDQMYRTPGGTSKGKKPRHVSARTTFAVAKILEAKYGLYSAYLRVHKADVTRALESSLQEAFESLGKGGPVGDPWKRGAQLIADGFKDFINSREAERVGIPGTPTKAALRGVTHRYAHPYRKSNPSRPSFRDTGTLVGNTVAWVSP